MLVGVVIAVNLILFGWLPGSEVSHGVDAPVTLLPRAAGDLSRVTEGMAQAAHSGDAQALLARFSEAEQALGDASVQLAAAQREIDALSEAKVAAVRQAEAAARRAAELEAVLARSDSAGDSRNAGVSGGDAIDGGDGAPQGLLRATAGRGDGGGGHAIARPCDDGPTVMASTGATLAYTGAPVGHGLAKFPALVEDPVEFKACEEEGHGWSKFRGWLNASKVICDNGPTTIRCAQLPQPLYTKGQKQNIANAKPKAWFCFFENLFEYAPRPAPSGEVLQAQSRAAVKTHESKRVLKQEAPRWIAYCKRRSGLDKKFNYWSDIPDEEKKLFETVFKGVPTDRPKYGPTPGPDVIPFRVLLGEDPDADHDGDGDHGHHHGDGGGGGGDAMSHHTHAHGAHHHQVLEIVEDDDALAAVRLGINPSAPVHGFQMPAAVAPSPFSYIAWGDCNGGNPGHCMGDSMNAFVVRGVMNASRGLTRVVLHQGFNDSAYTEVQGGQQKTAMRSAHESGHTFIDDWHALATTVHDATHEVQQWSISALRLLPRAAFSPLGMHALHWRHQRDSACRGKAPVAMDYQRALLEHARDHTFSGIGAVGGCEWLRSISEIVTVPDKATGGGGGGGGGAGAAAAGATTGRRLLVNVDPPPGMEVPSHEPRVSRIATSAPTLARPAVPAHPASPAKASPIRLFNADQCHIDTALRTVGKPHSNVITWLLRTTSRRITNSQAIGEELARQFPHNPVLLIDLGALSSYGEQALVFHLSHIIIGMHGGAMWNAVRWLSSQLDQRMLEIMPVLGPGTTCNIAEMMGLRYRTVVCSACTGKSDFTGELPASKLIDTVKKLAAPMNSTEFETDCNSV